MTFLQPINLAVCHRRHAFTYGQFEMCDRNTESETLFRHLDPKITYSYPCVLLNNLDIVKYGEKIKSAD